MYLMLLREVINFFELVLSIEVLLVFFKLVYQYGNSDVQIGLKSIESRIYIIIFLLFCGFFIVVDYSQL